MSDILEKLRGGDRRSTGRADAVAQEVENNPALFESLFAGLSADESVVRMRSADAIEKVTRNRPELLTAYRMRIISLLATAEQQELCWHLAQIVPRLDCDEVEEKEVIGSLKGYLQHKSEIVKVSAMESLAIIAQRNSAVLLEVVELISTQMVTGRPAVRARGRKLLQRLGTG